MRSVNTFIGSPVERVEDLRFLRGGGQYVDDLDREGQWHAAGPLHCSRFQHSGLIGALTVAPTRVKLAPSLDSFISAFPGRFLNAVSAKKKATETQKRSNKVVPPSRRRIAGQ